MHLDPPPSVTPISKIITESQTKDVVANKVTIDSKEINAKLNSQWITWFYAIFENRNKEYLSFASVSTATTLDKESVLLVDTNGGAITITVPLAADNEGRCYYVKDVDGGANAVTLARSGTDTIDGLTTLVLATAKGTAKIISDGANWHRIGN